MKTKVTVFGGMHNDDTKVDTNITMNGGTVKNIMAGGLHKSSVGNAGIIINGGSVTGSVMGGGYAGFVNDTDFSTSTYNPTYSATDQSELTIRVEKSFITINGGDVNNIFGGGGGHNYVGETSIFVSEEYEGTTDYLIAGGSHGYTGKATVTLNGGEFGVVQSVNRGFMNSSVTDIDGATVENAYVGGEPYTDPKTPGNSVTGVIASAEMNVISGEVENLSDPGGIL